MTFDDFKGKVVASVKRIHPAEIVVRFTDNTALVLSGHTCNYDDVEIIANTITELFMPVSE